MKKFFEGIVLMLLFAVVLPGTKVYAADDGRIAKGVTIGGIDVSGLDSLEAEREVSAYVNELSAKELTLHVDDGKELTFTGEDIGLYWSNTGVVDEALGRCIDNNITDWGKIKTAIKDDLGGFLWRRTKRNPMILPIITEV